MSSKMPKNNAVEIGLERKYVLYVVTVLLCAVACFVALIYTQTDTRTVRLGTNTFKLELATTPAQHAVGLSGRDTIDPNGGMLFVFDTPAQYCFWMKDTHISLDILWLDREGQVIDLIENVDPASYPESFCPDKDASYVVELPAGSVTSSGVVVGTRTDF